MPDHGSDSVTSLCMRCTRGSLNTHRPGHIPARILWPALGFPAVVDPGDPSKSDDATTCVTVVIISKRPRITRKQAAEHLRFVPWEDRHTRYLPPSSANSFIEDEIQVRATPESWEESIKNPGVVAPYADDFALQLYFGYDKTINNGFSGGLSRFVLKKYEEWGYRYLQEIRVSRGASSRVAAGRYNLFWINADAKDTKNDISDELALLIESFAKPTRQNLMSSLSDRFGDNTDQAKDFESFLLKEYEYDYDALHRPYNQGVSQQADPARRTEVLHPLFVQKAVPHLQIGHITDLHVDVRSDVYEYNLKKGGFICEIGGQKIWGEHVDFNNWNTSVTKLYTQAKQSCDVLLLTGDLIDYGRGHMGIPSGKQDSIAADLSDDGAYHVDRNWFLFYCILASGTSYVKPTYTILGNHDWRINPYTPFAIAGAPDPKSLINDYNRYKPQHTGSNQEAEEELYKCLNKILLKAHGPGAEKAFTYLMEATNTLEFAKEQPEEFYKTLWALLKNTQTMNIKNAPTETKIESVAWYLLLINPFLDYAFHLPGGYDILMLDWAKDENVLFPIVVNGKEWDYLPTQAAVAAAAGPKARNCLTDLQKHLVEQFVAKPGVAKVLGIHAPPIGPYPAWTDDTLASGRMDLPEDDHSKHYKTIYPDGTSVSWRPIYAVRPPDGPFGEAADYGSFEKYRDWLINQLGKDGASVRLVFSGHIHRNGLFVVYTPQSSALAGLMLVRGITAPMVGGSNPPEVTRLPEGEHGPLYVNTTSAGPRGHIYLPGAAEYVDSGYSVTVLSSNGTIQKVEFRSAKSAVAPMAARS
jgi:hypothetical protein